MSNRLIARLLDRFSDDPVIALGRRDPPTHALARSVHAATGSDAIVVFELIDSPPPPQAVAYGGDFDEVDLPPHLSWFAMSTELGIDENVERLVDHVRDAITQQGRRPLPPRAAIEPPRLGASTAVSLPPRSTPPPEPPPPAPEPFAIEGPPSSGRGELGASTRKIPKAVPASRERAAPPSAEPSSPSPSPSSPSPSSPSPSSHPSEAPPPPRPRPRREPSARETGRPPEPPPPRPFFAPEDD